MAEQWQIETAPYIPRISTAIQLLGPACKEFNRIPPGPFSSSLSLEQHIAYSLAMFSRSGLTVVEQLFDNVGLLWSQGRMIGISGMVRFSVEYWGAVAFGKEILMSYTVDKNIESAYRRTARLVYSAKTPVRLPWGGRTENVAYSVMNFIDALTVERPSIRDDYNFLSEASHPNFFQNFYFLMASKTHDNFSNNSFKAHAHEILERTILVMEKVSDGLTADATCICEVAIPLLGDIVE